MTVEGQGSVTAVEANRTTEKNINSNIRVPEVSTANRIIFSKGADFATAHLSLDPESSQKFVVRAMKGQTMDVEVTSKETAVNLIAGKAKTTEDFGYLTANLLVNGDYVFEVRNSTRRPIKTLLKVTVVGKTSEHEEVKDLENEN